MTLVPQLFRHSSLSTATCLLLLCACSGDVARTGDASESAGLLASSALASESFQRSSAKPVTRPVLVRRSPSTAQVVEGPPDQPVSTLPGSQREPDMATAQATAVETRPAAAVVTAQASTRDTTEVENDTDGDEDHAETDGDDEPEISARERTLAWLADDSFGRDFPAPTARTGAGSSVPRLTLPERPLEFVRPEAVKGVYLNAWAAGSSTRSQALIDLATRTEINAFVIDIKDASGYVSHPTGVMTAREAGADQEIRIRDLPGLLERLHEAGIYPIARIVIVKDPLLIRARPDWAVQDTAGGVWVDSKGLLWANLHDQRVWEYHVELAKEAAAIGFPEVQWDYVRFADAPQADLDRAVYPGADGRRRRDAVQAFLEYARAELEESGITVTMDVFGATTSAESDVGIGQYWESFIGSIDVALPMVYPSHYWVGSFGVDDPNGHPYEIVRAALLSGLRRSEALEGAGSIRPWIQDFTLGAPRYEAPEVRAQIQAAYDVGIDEWVLWNPSSRYTEDALEPAGGYPSGVEPMVRVGGRIVPVSERFKAIEDEARERARDRARARVVADSLAAVAADGAAAAPAIVADGSAIR